VFFLIEGHFFSDILLGGLTRSFIRVEDYYLLHNHLLKFLHQKLLVMKNLISLIKISFCLISFSITTAAQGIEVKDQDNNLLLLVDDKGAVGETTTSSLLGDSLMLYAYPMPPLFTLDKLYNLSGDLYWNGNQLGLMGNSGVWMKSGTNIFLSTLTDKVGIGTNAPLSRLAVGGQGNAIYNFASYSFDNGHSAVYGQADNHGNGGLFIGLGENSHGIVGMGGEGVTGTSSYNLGTGIYGHASFSDPSSTNYGGKFLADGETSYGLHAEATGLFGRGIYAASTNSAFGSINYGGKFLANGETGYGLYSEATGFSGYGIKALASNTGYATNFGGYFEAGGTSGYGVYGRSTATGDEINYGGYFESAGNFGAGVYGVTNGTLGSGVYGSALAIGDVTTYGGYFTAQGDNSRGVYANVPGNTATGVLSEASGNEAKAIHGKATNNGDFANYGGFFEAAGVSGSGIYATASGISGYGLRTNATGENGTGLYSRAFGASGDAIYGVSSGGTNVKAVRGYATDANATESYGGYFISDAEIGVGVLGKSTSDANALNYGGKFEAAGATARAVYGEATSSGDHENFGGYFVSNGRDGYGILSFTTGSNSVGIKAETIGTNSFTRGVYGIASHNGAVTNYGGCFDASGLTGAGVYGVADNTGAGTNYGGKFEAYGTTARAVSGEASNTGDELNYGGYFIARGKQGIGVYGKATNGAIGIKYGGYFTATGDYSVGAFASSEDFFGVGLEAEGSYIGVKATGDTGVKATGGTGVEAISTNSGGAGIFSTANGEFGTGVWGIAEGNYGKGVVGLGGNYDFYANGEGEDYGSASSIRWKSNIIRIDKPLYKLSKIRGVYFDWDSEHGGQHDVGCIAEEIGKVLPEIVVYEKNGIDAEGMDYSKLTPLLIEVAKAQQELIEQQQKQLDQLGEKLIHLEKILQTKINQ
jgi:hypothetical protein